MNQKLDFFNKLASLKIDINSLGFKKNNSIKNIDNGEVLPFLVEILKTLEDVNQLKEVIIDVLFRESSEVNKNITLKIKSTINDIILCSGDTKITSDYISNGFVIPIKSIDYKGLLTIDPLSDEGKLLYKSSGGINSEDFNTFLYYAISGGGVNNWRNIISVEYLPTYGNQIHCLRAKVHPSYLNKKASKFFSDLIDLMGKNFDFRKTLNSMIDNTYGTVSNSLGKTSNKLTEELQVEYLLDKIIDKNNNLDLFEDISINNNDLIKIMNEADNKAKGLPGYEELGMSNYLNLSGITQINNNIGVSVDRFEIDRILSDSLNSLGSLNIDLAINPVDRPMVNFSFIDNIIKQSGRTLSYNVISPKYMFVYCLANKMATNEDVVDVKDFILINKNTISNIVGEVGKSIIDIIFNRIKKQITELIKNEVSERVKERSLNKLKVLKSFKI